MNRSIPILVGGAVGVYIWRNRFGAPLHRNSGITYRPLGKSGEPYPNWVRDLNGKSGVYVIREVARDGSKQIVYVGESHTDRLYNTLTRRFQKVRHEAQEVPMT